MILVKNSMILSNVSVLFWINYSIALIASVKFSGIGFVVSSAASENVSCFFCDVERDLEPSRLCFFSFLFDLDLPVRGETGTSRVGFLTSGILFPSGSSLNVESVRSRLSDFASYCIVIYISLT